MSFCGDLCTPDFDYCGKQGADIRIPFQLCDDDDNPIDITGWILEYKAKENIGDLSLAIDAKTGDIDSSRIEFIDAENGTFELIVEASETELLDYKKTYAHEMKYTESGGQIDFFFCGTLTVKRSL